MSEVRLRGDLAGRAASRIRLPGTLLLSLLMQVCCLECLGADVQGEDPLTSPETFPSSFTFDPRMPLRVTIAGGLAIEGAFSRSDRDYLVILTPAGERKLRRELVDEVQVGGTCFGGGAFLDLLRNWQAQRQVNLGPSPAPWLVGSASLLWAGAGPAMLGNWQDFVGYSMVELSFAGAGLWFVSERGYGMILPIVLLDGIVRAYATGDSVGTARARKRARIQDGRSGKIGMIQGENRYIDVPPQYFCLTPPIPGMDERTSRSATCF